MVKKLITILLLGLWGITAGQVRAAELFNVDLETGNLNQCSSSVTDGGNLSVGTSAKIFGNYGLNLLINDTNQLACNILNQPKTTSFRYRFYIDPNSIAMANNDQFGINYVKQNGGSFNAITSLQLKYESVNGYKLIFSGSNDAGSAVISDNEIITDAPHYVEVAALSAGTSSSNDGSYEWWIDGVSMGSITGVDNYNRMQDYNWYFQMGAIDSIDVGTNGNFYIDEWKANNDGGVIGGVSNFPASSNYKLQGFSFGNAGGGQIGSSNYGVVGNMGEVSAEKIGSSNYDLGAGLAFIRQSPTPKSPTLINNGNYYNKLHLTLDNTQGLPSDTKYAVAISADNWVTTNYVKSDMTVGSTLAMTDYLTYTLWGGSSGTNIIGLGAGTTYAVKVKSMQGQYSESGYSVGVTAATIMPSLTFDIDISPTDVATTPPYIISFGDLYPGSVYTSTDKIWVSLDTNAASGGSVFVYGQNGGLFSLSAGYTIPTVSGNLGVLSNGFGAQAVGSTQTSGGPLTFDALYSGAGDVVGTTDTLVRQLLVTTNPVTSGRASVLVKAKSDNNVPAASDYTETLTIIAAANY